MILFRDNLNIDFIYFDSYITTSWRCWWWHLCSSQLCFDFDERLLFMQINILVWASTNVRSQPMTVSIWNLTFSLLVLDSLYWRKSLTWSELHGVHCLIFLVLILYGYRTIKGLKVVLTLAEISFLTDWVTHILAMQASFWCGISWAVNFLLIFFLFMI